jgi:hypothetical protein
MTLGDLRKLSIRKQYRIHFRLRNAMECIVSEYGIAQVPALKKNPDFNLEEELAAAGEFLIEPALVADRKKPEPPRTLRREEMIAMLAGGPASGAAHDEHDDE